MFYRLFYKGQRIFLMVPVTGFHMTVSGHEFGHILINNRVHLLQRIWNGKIHSLDQRVFQLLVHGLEHTGQSPKHRMDIPG